MTRDLRKDDSGIIWKNLYSVDVVAKHTSAPGLRVGVPHGADAYGELSDQAWETRVTGAECQ